MKKLFPYSTLLQGFIYLFLIGQLWVSTINYCNWMIDSETELVELNPSEDSESEEENEGKEKKDKNRVPLFSHNSAVDIFKLNSFCFENLISIHHPDVTTPPPKFSIQYS